MDLRHLPPEKNIVFQATTIDFDVERELQLLINALIINEKKPLFNMILVMCTMSVWAVFKGPLSG